MTPYEELREKHVASLGSLVPAALDRLTWSADRLAVHRTVELRRLLRAAREASPWHRDRLAGIDVDAVDESDLTALPVMTKDDLMTDFDAVVTDERLRRDVVEEHLAGLTGDAYLFDRYRTCASGGASGRRSVVIYDWDAWATMFLTVYRHPLRAQMTDPEPAGAPQSAAFVTSGAPHHISGVTRTFANPQLVVHSYPVDLPVDRIVAGLNAAQPTALVGYPSVLHALAAEVSAGRLRITPREIGSVSEPLLPETRTLLEETFGVAVLNAYGASEVGGVATSCRAGRGLHLTDDLLIVEPVDSAGRPVPPGTRCDKVYVTNLYNHAQPFVRYELTDQFTVLDSDEPCPCGCTHRRISDPYGRLDDTFTYGEVAVHPHVFRSPLARHGEVVDYQVRQTGAGAAIDVVASAPCDTAVLETEIATGLSRAGLTDPKVEVRLVPRIPRPPSGKLARFVATATVG